MTEKGEGLHMGKVKEYRYVERKYDNQTDFNIAVKEMIHMIKHEEVKRTLHVSGIKLSTHALERVEEHLGISNLATATRKIKEMLTKATRIGDILSTDGRINVLFAYDKTAIYLSPDLKTVVTVNVYPEITYYQILEEMNGATEKELALKLHYQYIESLEKEEREQIEKMLQLDKQANEAIMLYKPLLRKRIGYKRKEEIKKMISDFNYSLKREAKKLFNIKVEKRKVCKSLVALY